MVVECSMGLKWKTSESSDKITVPVNDHGGRRPVCSGEQDVVWQFRSLFDLKKVKTVFILGDTQWK